MAVFERNVREILAQRDVLLTWLVQTAKSRQSGTHGIGKIIGGFDANFLLVQFVNREGNPDNTVALSLYTTLAETKGVVVRFRGNETACTGALRITIGTACETQVLIQHLREWAQ